MLIDAALDAIVTRLETINGLTVTIDPEATVVTPMARVLDGEMRYHASFGRGHDELTVNITVYVSDADSSSGVEEARDYKSGHGDKSIRAALETSAGGNDTFPNSSIKAETGNVGVVEHGGGRYIALQLEATALIPGTA